MKLSTPPEVEHIASKLRGATFQAYLVGGCVRDLLLGRPPKDWDIATDATPEEIQKLFPESVYENTFGTVGVKTDAEDPMVKVVEVTTFRLEGRYTDKRHPDEVRFAKTIGEDLSRRDFTVNAIALELPGGAIVDPYGGQDDIKAKLIRTVGDPKARFSEDALRLMRAVRLSAELGFEIDAATAKAVGTEAKLLEVIAPERIRDEFQKLIMSDGAAEGVRLLERLGLLRFILPELREGIGCRQNKHHIYTVFDHNVRALEYAVRQGYPLEIRLAAFLHDVGKPRAKRGEGPDATFYGHEYVGAKMVLKMLDRLRFPKVTIERVAHLVRSHMFYYNTGEVSAAGVRRFLSRVGPENVDDIMKVREADRIGSGVPKAVVYKMRHLLFMIEKVRRDPVSPKMLAVRGDDVMRIAGIGPSPKIGQILDILLEEVIDDPRGNTKEHLEARVEKLAALSDGELQAMRAKARERKEEFESGVEDEMKRKYYVQ